MNHLRAILFLVAMLVCLLSTSGVRAQHVETTVENAEVVYVEGNDVVIRLTDGEVRQFEIPDSFTFTIDGKHVTVHELKPGMKLTAKITTATAPRWVEAVTITEVGTVWKASGSNLIIKTPEGENKMYRVPSGGKLTIGGLEKTLDQLHEGDKITATVVTTTVPSEVGYATAHVQTPATPARVGILLIDEGTKPDEHPGMWGTSTVIILVIALLLLTALILLAVLRKQKHDQSKKPSIPPGKSNS
jgi:hypothetical protein